MEKLIFDKWGYLSPSGALDGDIDLLKQFFVDAFPGNMQRRKLYDNYLWYLYRFQDKVFPFFEQWIDGSFVSLSENPEDIDIVTFLDHEVYEARGEALLDQFWTFSLEHKLIDAYIVISYPTEHPNYSIYKNEKELWANRYGFDRKNRGKGFLKLVFTK